MTPQLKVYKASAGAGKTFTLAVEYISLLIESPTAYRHILAVTFTNKATAEMKQRILSQLNGIAKGYDDSASYRRCIEERFANLSRRQIAARAQEALEHLLHDYSRFRVLTIDAFFQTVMRGLARELGIGTNLQVELNNERAISDAVDKLIERLDEETPLLHWLLEYIQENIEENKNWRIRDEIKRFSQNIFKEVYLEKGDQLRSQLNDTAAISAYRKQLSDLRREAAERLRRYGDTFFGVAAAQGIDEGDLYQKGKGVWGFFKSLREGIAKEPNSYVLACLADPQKWSAAKSPRRALIAQLAQEQLHPLLSEAIEEAPKIGRIVNSCDLSLRYYHRLRLLNRIDEEINRQNEEQNRFLLAKTSALLSKLEENDTSFVFEKTGSEIRHILIDEFQDTSRMQWNNFRILLAESLSQGFDSLIVGDVKQAIYRWRNSDWGIFNNLQEENPRFPVQACDLLTNRRSSPNVVNFNNRLFGLAPQEVNAQFERAFGRKSDQIDKAYRNAAQELNPTADCPGYVQVSFIEGDSYIEETLAKTVEKVMELQAAGTPLSEMSILLRHNKYIPLLADTFGRMHPEVPLVSDEAFRMDASYAVRLLVEALRYISNPQDTLALAQLLFFAHRSRGGTPTLAPQELLLHPHKEELLPHEFRQRSGDYCNMPLYELLEQLYRLLGIGAIENQDAYLFAFFDAVNDYLQRNEGDIKSFLAYWDDELCRKTIPSGEMGGLRVYSIHKSKGLEFGTVLIPFCDWELEDARHRNQLWCIPHEPPFDRLSLLPIPYGSSMGQSIFCDDYRNEYLFQLVDNLNLLYVALTRARRALYVWCRRDKKNSVSSLMQELLPRFGLEGGEWDDENYSYRLGRPQDALAPCRSEESPAAASPNALLQQAAPLPVEMQSHELRVPFKQSRKAFLFLRGEPDDEQERRRLHYIDSGQLLHYLFATIERADEVESRLDEMESEGLIASRQERSRIEQLVRRALQNPQAADWFGGRYRLYNECTLLFRSGGVLQSRRPDRVMTLGDTAIVVDFKFGVPHPQHTAQVQEYMQLMRRMGYQAPQGFLWYVYSDKIEEVKP